MKLSKGIFDDMEYKEDIRNGIWSHKTETYQDFFMICHAEMFPDDHKYEMIHGALDIILNYDDDDYSEGIDSKVPIYNHELLSWFSSSMNRVSYTEDAIKEYGIDDNNVDLMKIIMMGYYKEQEEVLYLAIEWIKDHVYDFYPE